MPFGVWVRVPSDAPAQKFPTPLRFPPAGGKLRYVGNFFAFRARFAPLDSGPRRTGDAGWDLSFFVYGFFAFRARFAPLDSGPRGTGDVGWDLSFFVCDFFAFRRGPLRWVRGGEDAGRRGWRFNQHGARTGTPLARCFFVGERTALPPAGLSRLCPGPRAGRGPLSISIAQSPAGGEQGGNPFAFLPSASRRKIPPCRKRFPP